VIEVRSSDAVDAQKLVDERGYVGLGDDPQLCWVDAVVVVAEHSPPFGVVRRSGGWAAGT